jgi:hypothetical protein
VNRELACIGWEVPPPVLAGVPTRRIRVEGAMAFLRQARGRSPVVAVGDGGIRSLDPGELVAAAQAANGTVLLVPTGRSLPLLPPWLREPGVVLAPLPKGEADLRDACATPIRRAIKGSLWIPRVRGEHRLKGRILEVLPLLPDLSVGGLAAALDEEVRTVEMVCRTLFGLTPLQLIDGYQEAYEEERRRERASWERISLEVGYAEVASLHKARRIRRARREGKGR